MPTMGRMTDVARATEMLKGIVAGIACDYEISDVEISKLREWLDMHANLLNRQPFKDLDTMLNRILVDQVIEEDEREELIEWCHEFSAPNSSVLTPITDGIRRLHGFLQGIAIDKRVTEFELADLVDWLHDYEGLRAYWPFDDVWAFVERIRADGCVTPDELHELLEFCQGFSEYQVDRDLVLDKHDLGNEPWMIAEAPVVLTLDAVCETNPQVRITGHSFCFTGNAASGNRKDLQDIVVALGASVSRTVTLDLDFLVVGSLSQPCWAYATYGRKIEAARENQKKGSGVRIIHEKDFVEAVRKESEQP